MTPGAMATLDPAAVPLSGSRLIEASAGTGKTYAIAALYLRLVVEGVATVDRILVVTYTVSATQELRDRIRVRLRDARAAFDGDPTDDELLAGIVRNHRDPRAARRRLDAALLGFDEAAVFTIHGFCQRVLADRAFEAGLPFDVEMATGEDEVLLEVACDWWRNAVDDITPEFAGYLLDAGWTPELALREVRGFRARRDVVRREPGAVDPVVFDAVLESHAALARRAGDMWWRRRDEIVGILRQHEGMSQRSYSPTILSDMASDLDRLLAPGTPRIKVWSKSASGRLAKFGAVALADGVNQGYQPPSDPFFDLFDEMWAARLRAEEVCKARVGTMLGDLLSRCIEETPRRKKAGRVRSFDDLLLDLHDALGADGSDGPMARSLRDRYRAALIDEFQDTDPLQYDIFRMMYGNTDLPVFTVGDPKQAIYSFRGADVFAYLDAREASADRSTLDTNWRADPGVVDAVNAMFGHSPLPFAIPSLDYRAVRAGVVKAKAPRVDGVPLAPMRIWNLGKDTKGRAEGRVAKAMAVEIGRMLGGSSPIPGHEIAVLVRTNKHARLVRNTLHRHGVASVMLSGESVFGSREAEELEVVLRAIASPGREAWARAALTTEMIGMTGDAMVNLDGDSEEWSDALEAFRGFRELWVRRGVVRMLRDLIDRYGVARRLLAFRDGERRMTNLNHLVELLQAGPGRDAGPEDVVRWLGERCREADIGPAVAEETRQLRLDSDDNLVRIVTVHRSKGLEYGVVFCPFPWWGGSSNRPSAVRTYHEVQGRGHDAVLDFRPDVPEDARTRIRIEDLSEDLRLLYVALTRARHHVTTAWGNIGTARKSAIAWLLHAGPEAGSEIAVKGVPALTGERLASDLADLGRVSGGTIEIAPLPEPDEDGAVDAVPRGSVVAARPPVAVPHPRWRGTSFSSLTRGTHDERPDRDAGTGPPAFLPDAGDVGTLLGFPGGTRAGSCLHAVLEHADLSRPEAPEHDALVHRSLQEHGYGDTLAPAVHAMLRTVADTALDPAGSVRLGALASSDRIAEMEFLYPVERLRHARLRAILEAHGVVCDPVRFDDVEGFLRGFIDLVFTHDGRWYVLDWKSNWLGPEVADYAAGRLPAAMSRERYVLQALLYLVALHRRLGRMLDGYDYDRNIGGAYYLFLRGLDPARGAATGVHHFQPSRGLIEALDAHLRGETP